MTSLSSPTKNGQKKDVFIQGIIFPTQAHKLNENCLNYIFTTFFCHINDIAMFNLVCKDWYKFLSENIYLWKLLLQKHFGSQVEQYISEQGAAMCSSSITKTRQLFLTFCQCLKRGTTLLITPARHCFHDKISKQEITCQGLGTFLPQVRDVKDNNNNNNNNNTKNNNNNNNNEKNNNINHQQHHPWNCVFDFERKHNRGFLIHHTEWDMRKFDFGVYDFTIELWCKFDEEFKNEDIMILNYAFFSPDKKGMDFYLASAWHRGKGEVNSDVTFVVADNSCELFNILDNPDDVEEIDVKKYNARCDNQYHHVAYVRSNGILSLYHDGERVAKCSCPFVIAPSNSDMFVGSRDNTNRYGLSELTTYRIYNGIAKYHGDAIEYLPRAARKWGFRSNGVEDAYKYINY